MSYTSSLFHVVFTTKSRQPVITHEFDSDLYKIMATIINKTRSKALLINGVEDHIHILLSLHPDVALSSLIRDLKSQSSLWMKQSGYFPMFEGWEREYGAFSLSHTHKEQVYNYILAQRDHHKTAKLDDEFQRLVKKNGLVYYFDR